MGSSRGQQRAFPAEWECGSGGRRGSRRWPRKKALSLFPSVVRWLLSLAGPHRNMHTHRADRCTVRREVDGEQRGQQRALPAPVELERRQRRAASVGGVGVRQRGSRRWPRKKARTRSHRGGGFYIRTREEAAAGRKRVMVLVDQSSWAKHAMMWALTHVANKEDFLTLLHVLPQGSDRGRGEDASALANSLGALCKACKPELCVQVA